MSTTGMHGRAVLLVNLGSPDSTSEKDVRRYLNEFLMDPHVINLPWLIRRLLLSLFILPTRPAKSAKAYQAIWWPEGSPLKVISERLTAKVQEEIDLPVTLAMRYGNPSMSDGLKYLSGLEGVREILIVLLYPHYAKSSVKTCLVEAKRIMSRYRLPQQLKSFPVFYNHPDYINALVKTAEPYLQQEWDHLLFSYHGVPENHIHSDDPTGNHCLKPDCCERPSDAHATCYRHQVYETSKAFAAQIGISDEKYSVAFQSRLGKAKWLEPATDQTLIQLAESGVKKLAVISPAFTADCLETLEELGMAGNEAFIEAGGEQMTLIPCLNDTDIWAKTLSRWISE